MVRSGQVIAFELTYEINSYPFALASPYLAALILFTLPNVMARPSHSRSAERASRLPRRGRWESEQRIL